MARQVNLSSRSAAGRGDLRAWSERVTAALEGGAEVRDVETPEIEPEFFCDYFIIYCQTDDA